MELTLKTISKEPQAYNWIIQRMNVYFVNEENFIQRIDVICLDIAKDLGMFYQRNENELCFKDKDK